MKKLTKRETEKVKIERAGHRNKNSAIYKAVMEIPVGESVVFRKDEWKAKSHPNMAIPSLTHKSKRGKEGEELYKKSRLGKGFIGKKFSILSVSENKAWMVIRIK